MNRQKGFCIFLLTTAITTLLCLSCQTNPAGKNGWPKISKEMRPWTRWWWMGNAVDQKNIDHLLEAYHNAGFGGVEITPIYGVNGYEKQFIQYLSPKWIDMLNAAVLKANNLDMGVDMNNGTGWPFGGPQITPQLAASKLIIQTYHLHAGQKLENKIVASGKDQRELGAILQCLTAYGPNGETLDLLNKVDQDGNLDWRPPTGNWELYAAFCGKTGQKVKRAAPGGAGYTMDHLNSGAVQQYLSRFDSAFHHKSPGVRCFFNDSYEVYNADWSPQFLEEFQHDRGYDLRPFIKMLVTDAANDTAARVKSDYRQTMSDMLLKNFTVPWSEWTHRYQAISRNQAHGSPGNLLDLYAAVDIPECETFGSADFAIPGLRKDTAALKLVPPDRVMLKFASSAAHVSGKKLASSETFTWLGEHFTVALSQCKPQVEQAFLAGVNHVLYHGTAYSPEDAQWPGWLFYASVDFAPSNSFWPHLTGLNDYITRCQSILQQGNADNELLVYWPIFDVWHDARGLYMPLQIHNIDQWLRSSPFYKCVNTLMDQGFSADFVSDNLLEKFQYQNHKIFSDSLSGQYKILVVPQCEFMPNATLKKIISLARSGATVVMQNLPKDIPGYNRLQGRRAERQQILGELQFEELNSEEKLAKVGAGVIVLSQNIEKSIQNQGTEPEQLVNTGLKFIRRVSGDEHYYYLVNHTPNKIDDFIPLNVRASAILIMDPLNGRTGRAKIKQEDNGTLARIQVKPGEAIFLKTSPESIKASPWSYIESSDAPMTVGGPWKLHFTNGGPVLPEDQQLDRLVSWTNLPDSNAVHFSGSAVYSTSFELSPEKSGDYVLKLGEVGASAKVWVNDKEVGVLWSIPFEVRIGKLLKTGNNTLKIEVANLMANRIRDMDRKGITWRKYHEINFVNLEYKPFDASNWEPMASGLMGPVTITPITTE